MEATSRRQGEAPGAAVIVDSRTRFNAGSTAFQHTERIGAPEAGNSGTGPARRRRREA